MIGKRYMVGVYYPQGSGLFDAPFYVWQVKTNWRIVAFYHEQRLGWREFWRFLRRKRCGTVVIRVNHYDR